MVAVVSSSDVLSEDPQAPSTSPPRIQKASKTRPRADLQASVTSFTQAPTGLPSRP